MRFDWLHFLGIPLLGYIVWTKGHNSFSIYELLKLLFISSLYLTHGYFLNDSFDAFKVNSKTIINPGKIILISYIFLLLNICFAFFLKREVVAIIICGGILSFIYNAPPLLLRRVPFIGTLVNASGFSLLFLIGYPLLKTDIFTPILFFLFFFIIMIPIQLLHELSHLHEDRLNESITTASLLGEKHTLIISILLLAVSSSWTVLIARKGYPSLFSVASMIFAILVTVYLIAKFRLNNLIGNTKIKSGLRKISIIYGLVIIFIFLL